MIIRIRTNLRTLKESIEPTATLAELMDLICDKLLVIDRTQPFTLSRDIFGHDIISATEGDTLASLNLSHGDEIHVLDRFDYFTIEKDYINENHDLVKAGKRAKVIEYFHKQVSSANGTASAAPVEENSTTVIENSVAAVPTVVQQPSTSSLPVPPTIETNTTNLVTNSQTEEDDAAAFQAAQNFIEDDDIRSPDEIRRLQLIEPLSPGLRRPELTSEDYRQLNMLRKQLLEAGLSQEEAELHVEEETNRILSERAINQLQFEERVGSTFGTMTSLEELEALLMTRRMRTQGLHSSVSNSNSNHSLVDNNSEASALRNNDRKQHQEPVGRRKFNDLLLQQAGRSVISATNHTAAGPTANSSSASQLPALSIVSSSNNANSRGSNNSNVNVVVRQRIVASRPHPIQKVKPIVTPPPPAASSAFEQICSSGSDLAQAVKASKQPAVVGANLPSLRSGVQNKPAASSAVRSNREIANNLVKKVEGALAHNEVETKDRSSGNGRISPRPPAVAAVAAPSSRLVAKPPSGAPTGGKAKATAAALPSSNASSAPSSAPNSARSAGSAGSGSSAGRQIVRRKSGAEEVPRDTNNKVASSRNDRQAQLLKLRDALDANIDKQLQREQSKLAQPTAVAAAAAPIARDDAQRKKNSIPGPVAEPRNAAIMRNFLQQGNARPVANDESALPIWLRQEIDRGIEDDLMQLGQRESRNVTQMHNPRPPNNSSGTRIPNANTAPSPVPAAVRQPECYYDEEDEMLAKALQASMEDF